VGYSGAGSAFLFSVILVLAAAPGDARSPSPFALDAAASIGSKWGIVTSTRRTREHNRLVGGALNSFHLSGRAIDIARRPGVRHADIEASYRNAGFVLVESLDEGDHSHFAFGAIGAEARLRKAMHIPAPPRAGASACRASLVSSDDIVQRRRPDRIGDCAPPDELAEAQAVAAGGAGGGK
jgi:hypothetical protein